MKSVELTQDEVIKWLASGMRLSNEFVEPLEAIVMRTEFPEAEIPRDHDEDDRWRKFLHLDTLDDAILCRYLSIDLSHKGGAILFYEHTGGWCFEHRRYMTEEERPGSEVLHYHTHGITDYQYNTMGMGKKEVLTYGSEVHNS